GAGKAAAASSAAAALGVQPVDVDNVIEQRLGKPIARVFAEDGEARFREVEERVTLDLLGAESAVLSLGGGAVTSAAVREALTDHRLQYVDDEHDTAIGRAHGADTPHPRARDAIA